MRGGDLYSAEDLWEEVWRQLLTSDSSRLLWRRPADMLKSSWSGLDVRSAAAVLGPAEMFYECRGGISPESETLKDVKERADGCEGEI